jgi:hypothetical protein
VLKVAMRLAEQAGNEQDAEQRADLIHRAM